MAATAAPVVSQNCPRVLATEHRQEGVVVFPKSLRTRFVEFWPYCGELLLRAIRKCLLPFRGIFDWLWKGGLVLLSVLAILFAIILIIFFFSMAALWIPAIMSHCHRAPGVALQNFTILDMTAFQSVSAAPDSPWQVKCACNANFSTWNRNTVAECFTTYRRMDVRVEYRGQVILQQQLPLGFSLKPRASRPFSIELKNDDAQLKKDLGPVMQAEMRSGNITLNFFFDIRYLIADRRSKWESNGCVVISNSPLDSSGLKTMVAQDCYTF